MIETKTRKADLAASSVSMAHKWTGCLISTTNHNWIRSKPRPEQSGENSTLNCDPRREIDTRRSTPRRAKAPG
jgi:hypothetical protein